MSVLRAVLLVAVVSAATADHYHRVEGTQNVRYPEGFNRDELTANYWANKARDGIKKRLSEIKNDKKARNVIMFLGDGLSVSTMTAARIYKGQLQNRPGEETEMFFETFPTIGLSKTYCLDRQIADSACTATAFHCGVKSNWGTIGISGEVQRRDCQAYLNTSTHLDSIAAWAIKAGKDAGIVTNTRITHASPAGAYARVANRGWENDAAVTGDGHDPTVCTDIAHQLVHTSPGNQFKVILGGGRRELLPNTTYDESGEPGKRTDGRNLIQEWLQDKTSRSLDHQYIANRSQLMSLKYSPPDYLLGLFANSHMPFHLQSDSEADPTLAELTEVAINSLSRNEDGYFLFVEGGRIDHAHHAIWPHLALDETVEFDKAVQKAVEMVGDDTLIVVTSDHSHVMAINGYTARGTPILGVSDSRDDHGRPFMTLSYTNGPGMRPHFDNMRPDVTQEPEFGRVDWRAHVDIPLWEETHGGDDVPVLAYGPQHHMFTGLYEQSQVPVMMAYAACIGPGLQADICSSAALFTPLVALYTLMLIILYRVID